MNGPTPPDRTTDHIPPRPPTGVGQPPPEETAPTLPNRPPASSAGSGGLTVSEGQVAAGVPSPVDPRTVLAPPALDRERIGRYRIQSRVGSGGFGMVFKGRDEELQRDVAIKIAHPHRVNTPEDVEAFLKEGRILAKLDHPAIVPIYDVGREDGLCYLVSKFIVGLDLAARVRHGRLSYAESAGLIANVADALHHAHQRGMVHRDVKPANIMLVAEDRPILVDFGLALRDQDFGLGPVCAGTPAYMSPEQAREEGHLVNLRSDIYSLGTVLYELLAGQRPFQADDHHALLELIKTREPTSLRHIDDTIPRELERICLKALSKRASDRHATARELAEDLRNWLAEQVGWAESSRPTGSAVLGLVPRPTLPMPSAHGLALKVVPKGLRSFDSGDADFFLKLLPGPCGRDGLPDSVRFWRQHLEETDADKTFRLGVLYGPSGCGKSSLVKAGLLPRLSNHVMSVYVEATPDDTEQRLLRGLRQRCPDLPESAGLVETLAYLRRGRLLPAGKKIVVVLDQFEQWLHARPITSGAGVWSPEHAPARALLQALRQCDGGRVQCVLLVRDDFWMSLIRFLRELEVPLREGENSAAVDRFDLGHARRVLAAFGRAYGALPEGEASAEQKRFLEQAVAGLAQDNEVVPVRLSLFAEMVKGKPWVPATLESVGGAKGIGVLFLEESFAAATAPPEQRLHQKAARAVLGALLPEAGSGIRGRLQPRRKLLEVSGYADQPQDFAELLHILDTRLRLITPTEPEQPAGARAPGESEVYYQLAHDYLVEPLRRWLTSKQRETLRGRAELRLADQAALWGARTERRHLPSLWGWLDALLWTRSDSWTPTQRRMMRAATRWHAIRAAVWLLLLIALGYFGAAGWKTFLDQRDAVLAQTATERLLHAEPAELPRLLADFDHHRHIAEPMLRTIADDPDRPPREKLLASLALLPSEPDRAASLSRAVYTADPEELPVLADALRPYHARLADVYWLVLRDRQSPADRRLRAACLLAAFAPDDPRWAGVADALAADFVAEKNPLHAGQWMQSLRPLRRPLVPPLTKLFRDGTTPARTRSFITSILADYAADDTPLLAELILEADQRSFGLLVESLRRDRAHAVARLTTELQRQPQGDWNDVSITDRPAPARTVREALEAAQGMLTERFAFCQTLPLADFESLTQELNGAGYRPSCLRPFDTQDGPRVAAIWVRDGRSWDWVKGATASDVQRKDAAVRRKGLIPVDLAWRAENGADRTFTALWVTPAANLMDAALYIEAPEKRHGDYWGPLLSRGFVPRSNLVAFDPDGQRRHSSIRWKFTSAGPEYDDRWDASAAEYEGLLARGWYQTDVRVVLTGEDNPPRYSGVWWNGKAGRQSRECRGFSPAEHKEALPADGERGLPSRRAVGGLECPRWSLRDRLGLAPADPD